MAKLAAYNVPDVLQGVNSYGLQMAEIKFSTTLAANTEATVTVPSGAPTGIAESSNTHRVVAVMSYEAASNIWVAVNETAAKPVGATLAAVTSMLNPPALLVNAGDVIHIISADAGKDVGIAFYSVP